MARGNYPQPAVARSFTSWAHKDSTTERVKDPRTGEIRRRTVDCWDVEGRADGVVWSKRFRRAGLAQTWKDRLDGDFAAGLPFDLRTKQLIPETPAGPPVLTVFDLTERYFQQHPHWEPKTKIAAANSFNRARRWLTVPGVVLDGDDLVAVKDFNDHASFLPEHLTPELTHRQTVGRDWLRTHSFPRTPSPPLR